MLQKSSFLATLLLTIASTTVNADIILFEDFEDATVTYTVSVADDVDELGTRDYFGRLHDVDTGLPPVDVSYSNRQGQGFYGVQDTDGTSSGNIDDITLDWTGIDVSNFENLSLSWFVAEDDATDGNEDWDTTSRFRILAQIDGGGFFNVFAIESELGTDGNETNEVPRVDTDFDETGDGAEITDTFTQFSSALANGGTLDLRVEIRDLDTGDEDVAFDNFLLEGDAIAAVPEPTSLALLSMAGAGLLFRRRRS